MKTSLLVPAFASSSVVTEKQLLTQDDGLASWPFAFAPGQGPLWNKPHVMREWQCGTLNVTIFLCAAHSFVKRKGKPRKS